MLAEILRRRFLHGVVVLPHAVSDQRGMRTLRIPLFDGEENLGRATIDNANQFDQSRDITVATVRLDDLALTDVGLLKIDVEGHEKSVLDGAIETIRREQPNLILELEERHHRGVTKQATDLLNDLGYKGLFLWNGRMLHQRLFNPEVHQKLHDGQPRAPYAWNFVFTSDDALLTRISRWTR
jgi:FkbM family methyltransferase